MPNTTSHDADSPFDPDSYITTIDLGGETVHVQRPPGESNVAVRKLREVVFDRRLFMGMAFTVHAEESRAEWAPDHSPNSAK